jgi:carboxymethylenebutenolidase
LPFATQLLAPTRPASAESALENVSVKTASGRTVAGVVAVPAAVPAPAVLLIHGSVGVSDNIKAFASHFARDGFFALALDLFDRRTATDPATRSTLVAEANSNPAKATETITTWIEWLKADPRTNGKVGVVGWSFGAEWAIKASIAAPVEATVIYVGVDFPGVEIARLQGPVLGHFGEYDTSVSKRVVETFERTMKDAGKSVEVHWYPGDHYFSLPSYPSYDKSSADAAWERTVQFFRANLQ